MTRQKEGLVEDHQNNSRDEMFLFRRSFRSGELGAETGLSECEVEEIEAALQHTRERMGRHYNELQVLGRRDPIGCVALEITQRCNLDCTLCYLSDSSEDVKDIPLEEIWRRLEQIKRDFGPGTVVQVTGGDPTLRKREELVEIVRRARALGLQPALFTNGILASRSLLEELTEAGLADVAFHVDLTQERQGYQSEMDLNSVREEYIERARGLPITVIFNTTCFKENFHEIPDLVRFFRENSDVVRFISFQLQADTGRGELEKRDVVITIDTIREQISKGVGKELNWDPLHLGHPDCHSFAYCFSVNGNMYDMVFEEKYLAEALEDFKHVFFDRRQGTLCNILPFLRVLAKKPKWIYRVLRYAFLQIRLMGADLFAARGRVNRLSFFIHNFMDADSLDQERVEACSFMVMTHEGPVSMCAHNAKRDEYILAPFEVEGEEGSYIWNPLNEKQRHKRKARGQRQWKLGVIPTNGGCGGCSSC